MKLVIYLDGNVFTAKDQPDMLVKKAAEQLYDNIDSISKLQLELEDGYLILNKESIARSAIKVIE